MDETLRISALVELRAGQSHPDPGRWKTSGIPLSLHLGLFRLPDFPQFCITKGMCDGGRGVPGSLGADAV